MKKKPIAFMSYVRFEDQHENGRLTEFCERLSGEVRMQTGEEFPIFQDRNDITWGQQWQQRIDESLDAGTFLIPIVTPGFFKSPPCRDEFKRFLEREKKLDRKDLVLPVYYVECAILSDEEKRKAEPLAKVIAARQYVDWRELRFEAFTSPEVGRTLAKMAKQILDALERGQSMKHQVASAVTVASGSKESGESTVLDSRERKKTSGGTVKSRRRPARKTEPPTLVVDALHRGDYTTLTEALNAASPGDRILVRPGLYKEGIVIEKPVEIVGDGGPGEVVIEATGADAVLFRANMGRIANLTLRQTGGGNWYCVDITQGRLDLEGCDITCQSLACVGIHGGADPRLCGNRIHDGKESGILIYENGQGTLEDNDIFANTKSGVTIKTGGNPTLRRNRISKNGYEAVWVYDGGQGVIEDNDLRENVRGPWDIAADCEDKVKRARNQE
jgi:F-box protein 11